MKSPRLSKGFAHTGGLLSKHIRGASQRRGFAQTELLTRWAEIVGPEIARVTRPSKVSFARGGLGATLVILTSGARAPELQMQLPVIRERVNACYGYQAIAKIRLTQTDAHSPGFAEERRPFTPAPPSPASRGERDVTAEYDLADVIDDDLRAALDALGNRVLNSQR